MKFASGRIEIGKKVRKWEKVIGAAKSIKGEIVKIVIYNNPEKTNNDLLRLVIKTMDNEKVVDNEIGNKSGIFYPPNYSAQNGWIEMGLAVTQQAGNYRERFYIEDPLIVQIINPGGKALIENIIFMVV